MSATALRIRSCLQSHHPFDALPAEALARLAATADVRDFAAGNVFYRADEPAPGLFVIESGTVEIVAPEGERLSLRHAGEVFGRRALAGDGSAPDQASAVEGGTVVLLPAAAVREAFAASDAFAAFFRRAAGRLAAVALRDVDISAVPITELITRDPVSVGPDVPVREAAALMDAGGISCVLVVREGHLEGILTTGDLTGRVIAAGRPGDTPVHEVMTPRPVTLGPRALGLDAFVAMAEGGIGHLPITQNGRPVGIVTRTNMLRRQAVSSMYLVGEIARAERPDALARVVARIPQLLAHLVGGGAEAHVTTRLVTDIADAVTRRLILLAEHRLGPAPMPYLWLACGSQGRREQTGVSDQDNCLILDDAAGPEHASYFAALASFVSDGLAACGYHYCPGDMMATNPRWRQPLAVWRRYFRGWIETPDPMAQMLASVMFDLRPIVGERTLFDGLQAETLRAARSNTIFVAHMIANSLKHTPPLGLFRGFALIRRGEHKDMLDLKLNGVVPVVDLGRIYALLGELSPVNTRARLEAAQEAGVVSLAGSRDLIDAYDFISETRLQHQARQIREGLKPDNFMAPSMLSDLERNYLKEAFLVVKTMQSALAQGRAAMT